MSKVEEKSSFLNNQLSFALSDFATFIEKNTVKKVAYFIWKNPFMVVGTNNYINEILRLNRFENVFENNNFESNRYPEIDIETLENKNLDLIFLSSEPYPFKENDKIDFQKYSNSKIEIVDGEMFSWHGYKLLYNFLKYSNANKSLDPCHENISPSTISIFEFEYFLKSILSFSLKG